jgi:Dyp-type peroxidase family
MAIDFGNVQGLLTQVYRYPVSRHLMFRFDGSAGSANGKNFLRELLPRLTHADQPLDTKPEPVINLSLTCQGLRTLGVAPDLVDQFDSQFKAGPDPFTLGDVPGSISDPALWWEQQFSATDLHCVVHLYTVNTIDAATDFVRDIATRTAVTELIPRRNGTRLEGRSLSGLRKLHFGFSDGFSQPEVAWDGNPTPGQFDYRNFVLGHATADVSSSPFSGPAADLARDSSYVAFRWLYQDVAGFNRFLNQNGPALFPDLPPDQAEELLAAKMMGRWRDGTPVELSPKSTNAALVTRNDFGYASDPQGLRCPVSAHVRVTNPRDQQLDPVVIGPVPRVLRRGMPYGPELNGLTDDGEDRGIIGLFICSDIDRQFNTLARWIKKNDFSPVYNSNRRVQDPLFANRKVFGTIPRFIIPTPTGNKIINGLPDFIHTKGTAFLLLPSLSTLQQLTA